jgi:hypothetical protein
MGEKMNKPQPINWETIRATAANGQLDWLILMDERQQKEIAFDRTYASDYSHGTDGHNARIIIARMAEILNAISANVKFE